MLGDDLRWFTTLAELERVGETAQRLRMAQPTLSRRLARLESRLGQRLFDRHGKRIILNDYGRVFYEHARRASAELDAAERALAELSNPVSGVVRLAYGASFGIWPVPQLISGFRRHAGNIPVTCVRTSPGRRPRECATVPRTSRSSPRVRRCSASGGSSCHSSASRWRCPRTTDRRDAAGSGCAMSTMLNSSCRLRDSTCVGHSTSCARRRASTPASHSRPWNWLRSPRWLPRGSDSRWYRCRERFPEWSFHVMCPSCRWPMKAPSVRLAWSGRQALSIPMLFALFVNTPLDRQSRIHKLHRLHYQSK